MALVPGEDTADGAATNTEREILRRGAKQRKRPRSFVCAGVLRRSKKDGLKQLERLWHVAEQQRWTVKTAVLEIGSGLNPGRKKIKRILADPEIRTIVVEHRDRLARFGVELMEAALSAEGRKLVVLEAKECEDDLVQDMRDVMTSLCARWYGRRAAKNRQSQKSP